MNLSNLDLISKFFSMACVRATVFIFVSHFVRVATSNAFCSAMSGCINALSEPFYFSISTMKLCVFVVILLDFKEILYALI